MLWWNCSKLFIKVCFCLNNKPVSGVTEEEAGFFFFSPFVSRASARLGLLGLFCFTIRASSLGFECLLPAVGAILSPPDFRECLQYSKQKTLSVFLLFFFLQDCWSKKMLLYHFSEQKQKKSPQLSFSLFIHPVLQKELMKNKEGAEVKSWDILLCLKWVQIKVEMARDVFFWRDILLRCIWASASTFPSFRIYQ